MQLKEYQQRVVDAFDRYLDALCAARDEAQRTLLALTGAGISGDIVRQVDDFPRKAWDDLRRQELLPRSRATKEYSGRRDGTDAPVPNVTLKVPTGGGKTLLATAAVARILNKFLEKNHGLVLWVVPNEAIYTQTKSQLSDREHPYRQMLDRASAGSVRILDKESPLDRLDLEGSLCVMLLMLQSAARETNKESLRLFRDRGSVRGFTPPGDDANGHAALISSVRNVDVYPATIDCPYPIVKDSLGNALRIAGPIIVLDEGHKGFSDLSVDTLYGFNPSFVLELSATPKDGEKRWANCLVDVRGQDLDREEMIKLPINLVIKAGGDWRDCLRDSLAKLDHLQNQSDRLLANSARYIRPIMLVQAERTGKETRESGKIHADDIVGFLKSLGMHENHIAVKTAEVNDLKEPERQDLLSPTNQIRVIVTKKALQEGWDCPFAYVLCSLAAAGNLSAMTQLVGRILRQPDAHDTGVRDLDECYVFCHHAQTGRIVQAIRAALEKDGMADVAGRIALEGGHNNSSSVTITRRRRSSLAGASLFAPRVMWSDGSAKRELDWESDILQHLDWSDVDLAPLICELAPGSGAAGSFVARIGLNVLGQPHRAYTGEVVAEAAQFDAVYATRAITDIVPNPWIAREIIAAFVELLAGAGWSAAQMGVSAGFLIEELRKRVGAERDRLVVRFPYNISIL